MVEVSINNQYWKNMKGWHPRLISHINLIHHHHNMQLHEKHFLFFFRLQQRPAASGGCPAILEEHAARDVTRDGSLIAGVRQGSLF